MTESMRRATVIGDAPGSRVRATGLGSPRNGLPPLRAYAHPGWVNGVPSAADNPEGSEERSEAVRQRLRQLREDALTAAGTCPECTYPFGSYGHFKACEDGS